MHVPDGFIDAPVSLATGMAAAGAVAVSLRGARRELAGGSRAANGGVDGTAPLAGLVAAFIFAVQMLNFPVAAGTSGHLLGGALAAILVGPYTGVLCVSVVLLMQGVLFADGGLTALGVNITDMGIVTVLVGYGVFRGLLKVLPRGSRRSVTAAAFVAALLSVPAAAVCFTGIYALGGTADVAIGKVFTAMVGVHVLIGIGEAVITAATVGAVMAVRPDLVHGARGFTRSLTLHTVTPAAPARAAAAPAAASSGAYAGRPADLPPGDGDGSPAPAAGGLAARKVGAADAAVGSTESAAPGNAGRTAPAAGAAERRSPAGAPGSSHAGRPAGLPSAGGDEAATPAGDGLAVRGAGAAAGSAALTARDAAVAGRSDAPSDRDGADTVGVSGASDSDAAVPAARAAAPSAAAADGRAAGVGAPGTKAPSGRKVWFAGLAAAAVCAGVVSFYASASPDGLNKVADDHGIGQQAEGSGTADSPLAGYSVAHISDDRLSGGLAGLIGVGGTLALGTGVFVVVRRRRTDDHAAVPAQTDTAAGAR